MNFKGIWNLFLRFRNTLSRFPLRCLSKYHKQARFRNTETSKSRVGRQHENAIREAQQSYWKTAQLDSRVIYMCVCDGC
jgi:hypothetical protein